MIPAVLILIYVAQCVWFARTQSLTYDEPLHVTAGQQAWRYGRFKLWNDHPSLSRLWPTALLRDSKWQMNLTGTEDRPWFTEIKPNPQALALRGRAMNIALGVLLAVVFWATAARLWSVGAANFGLALFAFSPQLIAHFSLITTDGISVLAMFLAAVQLIRWRRSPTWREAVVLGLVMALLLLSKFTAPAFVAIGLLVALVTGPPGLIKSPRKWHWGKIGFVLILALLCVWAAYFFHVTHLTVKDGQMVATFPHRDSFAKQTNAIRNLDVWIPAGEYVDGIRQVKFHNRVGHAAYLMGHITWGKLKAYYPIVIALKWPLVVLLLGVGAAVILGRRGIRNPDFWILAVPPFLLFVMMLTAKIHVGERHILPIYVFVLLGISGLWEAAARWRSWHIVLLALLMLNAVDTLRVAPNYLRYFNPLVAREHAWRYVTDSNLDWGQGLLELKKYQDQHPDETIHLAYFGTVDPKVYGINYQRLEPKQRVTGIVVVSATMLSGQYLDEPDSYRWVLRYPQVQELGASLLGFRVD